MWCVIEKVNKKWTNKEGGSCEVEEAERSTKY